MEQAVRKQDSIGGAILHPVRAGGAGILRQKGTHTAEEYYTTPEDARVELIKGVFYDMAAPSPVHQRILGELYYMIRDHIRKNGGPCQVYMAPFDVKLDTGDEEDTVVQPDISVICDPSRIDERGCNGAPDWVVEITSPGNAETDYLRKLSLYLDAGVRLYWILNPMDRILNVYEMSDDNFTVSQHMMDHPVGTIYEDLSIDLKELQAVI